ncbi:MAG TPA: SDR family NAD(P)-dependent oxidoreductase [Burkholderiales bacterium]|nr:SDR family NAD(P)-dependent oxidoreductase [Burkholderiales bacterium]
MERETALIVGAGSGLSAALARLFAREGLALALAARNPGKLTALTAETGAVAFACDTSVVEQVDRLFADLDQRVGAPSLVVYNAGLRVRGPIEALDPAEVQRAWLVGCFGGFLVAQQAARRMLRAGRGTLIFTGATASVKGFPQSSAFAMGKFALRGLAQSLARELAPKGVHVAHVVIDGGIASSYAKTDQDRTSDRFLNPNAIAGEYLNLHRQHRSAWSWELELRPHTENF